MSSQTIFNDQASNDNQKQDQTNDLKFRLQKLEKTNEELKKQLEELEHKYKRARADYLNLERRFSKEKEEVIRFANSVLITEFLSILDDLEKAQNHFKDDGLDLIVKKFLDILKAQGVKEIEVQKKDFDPEIMECVERVGEGNRVKEAVGRGYKMGEKVLRVARVKVG